MLNLLWPWSGRLCVIKEVGACTSGHPGDTGIPLACTHIYTHTRERFEALPACSSWRASICQERLSLGSSWRRIFVDQPTSPCTSSLKKGIINWNYHHTSQVYPEYPPCVIPFPGLFCSLGNQAPFQCFSHLPNWLKFWKTISYCNISSVPVYSFPVHFLVCCPGVWKVRPVVCQTWVKVFYGLFTLWDERPALNILEL